MFEAEIAYIIYNEVYTCNRCTKCNPECEIYRLWDSYFDRIDDAGAIELTEALNASLRGVNVCCFHSTDGDRMIKRLLEPKIDSYLNFLASIT